MKKIKFSKELIPLIMNGEKTTTWRINDDKNLMARDILTLTNTDNVEFARGRIIEVKEKMFMDMNDKEREELRELNENHYNIEINDLTKLKKIRFKIL